MTGSKFYYASENARMDLERQTKRITGRFLKPDQLDLEDDQWEWGYREGQLVRVVKDGVD